MAPKWSPKWCPGGSEIEPRRTQGHPLGTGNCPGPPLDLPGPHFGSSGALRDIIFLHFVQTFGLRMAERLTNFGSGWQHHQQEQEQEKEQEQEQ